MLLDQGIFAMEGDRVEVLGRRNDHGADRAGSRRRTSSGIVRVADRVDPATVFGQERSLGDDVQSGEEGQSLVQNPAHDMAVACRPEQLKAKSDRRAKPGGIISNPGNPAAWRMRSRGIEAREWAGRGTGRRIGSQTSGLRSSCRTSATSAVVGREPGGRSSSARRGKQDESFVLESLGDGDRAEGMSLVGQIAADVVDGEVLLSQGDDAVTEGIALGCGMRPLGRCEEEVTSGTLAELVDKDAEAPPGCNRSGEPPRRPGKAVDEEGAGGPRTGDGWRWWVRGRPGRVR